MNKKISLWFALGCILIFGGTAICSELREANRDMSKAWRGRDRLMHFPPKKITIIPDGKDDILFRAHSEQSIDDETALVEEAAGLAKDECFTENFRTCTLKSSHITIESGQKRVGHALVQAMNPFRAEKTYDNPLGWHYASATSVPQDNKETALTLARKRALSRCYSLGAVFCREINSYTVMDEKNVFRGRSLVFFPGRSAWNWGALLELKGPDEKSAQEKAVRIALLQCIEQNESDKPRRYAPCCTRLSYSYSYHDPRRAPGQQTVFVGSSVAQAWNGPCPPQDP